MTTTPIWQVSLLRSDGETPVSAEDVQCPFVSPEIGVTSTPVMDNQTGTIHVLTGSKRRTNSFSSTEYFQRLHALAITTGKEKFGGPAFGVFDLERCGDDEEVTGKTNDEIDGSWRQLHTS